MIRCAQICKYGIEDGFLLWWGALLYKVTNGTYAYAPCRSIMFHLFRDPEKVQISKTGHYFFRPWKVINCSNLNVVRAIFWQQRPGQNPSVLSAILEILAMDARIECLTIQLATPDTALQSSTHTHAHIYIYIHIFIYIYTLIMNDIMHIIYKYYIYIVD